LESVSTGIHKISSRVLSGKKNPHQKMKLLTKETTSYLTQVAQRSKNVVLRPVQGDHVSALAKYRFFSLLWL